MELSDLTTSLAITAKWLTECDYKATLEVLANAKQFAIEQREQCRSSYHDAWERRCELVQQIAAIDRAIIIITAIGPDGVRRIQEACDGD